MHRKFISNLSFLIFVNFLVKPFWILGIDRTVQNTVGSESYGIYFALFNLSLLFHVVLDMGLSTYNNKLIAQDKESMSKMFSNIVLIKLLFSIIYLIITFVFAFFWGFDENRLFLLGLLTFNQIISSAILFLRSNITALFHFKIDSILSVMDKILMILICSVLLWGGVTKSSFKVEWLIYAQTVAYLLTLLIAIGIIVKYKVNDFKAPALKNTISVLKQSYPYAMLVMLMTLYYRIDGVMIEKFAGAEGELEAGFYALGYRLLDAANMLGYLFSILLLPMFAKMIKEKESIHKLLQIALNNIFVIATVVAVPAFLYKRQIMELLYVESSGYTADIFGILILCLIATSIIYIYGTLLTANGNLKRLNILALISVMLNIILNYFLIQKYKALGAAQATLITQLFIAIAHIIIAKKQFSLNILLKNLFKYFAHISIIFILAYSLNYLFDSWQLNIMITILLSVLFAFLLKLIDVKEMIRVVSKS